MIDSIRFIVLFSIVLELQSANGKGDESLRGCSLSSVSKCHSTFTPNRSTPSHLIEKIGQISDAQTCQIFCKNLYSERCEWFMFDRTTNDCMLFTGSLEALRSDCREFVYTKEPDYSLCDVLLESNTTNGCYNFREDYCRFEFSLLENLEDIENLADCQQACGDVSNCSFFVYDTSVKTCKLNAVGSSRPVCDIMHGTPKPDFRSCVRDGHVAWAPVNGQWGSWSSYSLCTKSCGTGTQERFRECNNPPPSENGNECIGSTEETRHCNSKSCPINGEWGLWSSYSTCTQTCGNGTQKRVRDCNNPSPTGDGSDCIGKAEEILKCNTNSCKVCKDSKSAKYCNKRRRYCQSTKVKQFCPTTCKLCCGNLWSDSKCREAKKKCRNKRVENKCRKTCGRCK